jgi:hypothetical protein
MRFKADFTNVSDSGGGLPVGNYICKITKAELKDGEKGKYIKWELTVGVGDQKGQKIYHNTSLTVKALFKLRDFMSACGLKVPKSMVDVDTDEIVGKIVGISVIAGTYVKDGVTKDKVDIDDIYEVEKTEKGWGKVGLANIDLEAPVAPPWAGNDDVSEIEI